MRFCRSMVILWLIIIGAFNLSNAAAQSNLLCTATVHASLPQDLSLWSSDTGSLYLELRNLQSPSVRVVLRMLIRKDSVLIAYTRAMDSKVYAIGPTSQGLQTADLFPAGSIEILPSLTRSLTRTGLIKPGEYTIQCQLLNADNFDEVVYEGCVMQCSVAGYVPPVLVEPPTYHWVTPSKEIMFTWNAITPLPTLPHTVRYKLLIWEVPEGSDPDEVDRRRKPTIQCWSDIRDPLSIRIKPRTIGLRAGSTYVWTVQAVDENGKAYGGNNGYAESFVMRVRR